MKTSVPSDYKDMVAPMKADHEALLRLLKKSGYSIEDYPKKIPQKKELNGEALAVAYPIQGILKYHGMPDWEYRTAFMSSISLNNDAAKTLTYVKFDPKMKVDLAFVNDKQASGRDLERVQQSLDIVRKLTGAKTKALVVSKNIVRATKTGKGLGTSASGSGALAEAIIGAALPELSSNRRFVTCIGRFLAGSGCRSVAGGVSMWMAYPGIEHEDSFALRLDTKNQFDDVSLVTVPIDSRIGLKTETAHKDAPHSPLYKLWMRGRQAHLIELIEAINKGDWKTLGQLAELDTILLHGVTMSGSRENKIVAWEPETIHLMRLANTLRDQGVPVYYSLDTGPTPVFITHKSNEDKVVAGIENLKMGFEVIRGKIAGPAQLLPIKEKETLLTDAIKAAL